MAPGVHDLVKPLSAVPEDEHNWAKVLQAGKEKLLGERETTF
jgi:hypothetical protein